MDDAFGRLMAYVDQAGLRDDTFVMFTSDNGPAITSRHPHGSAGPLRDKKGYLYEGGIRVPGMIRWPGHTRPGQVSDEPVSGVDLLPTLCEIAGIPVPTDRAIDGTSFLPAIDGKPISREPPLYWQFNYSRGAPKVAARLGDWKILATLSGPVLPPGGDITAEQQRAIKQAELADFELYNLARGTSGDIDESDDLSETEPNQFADMKAKLQAMYSSVQKECPIWPDWTWPRYEGKIIRAYYEAQKNQ